MAWSMEVCVFFFCLISVNVLAGPVKDNDNELWRIAGGAPQTIEKHPYALAIFADGELSGAGVILNRRWGLTTGFNVHFVMPNELKLVAGSANTTAGGTTIRVARFIKHPRYTGQWDYNVALIKFKKPISFKSTIRPIAVARSLPPEMSIAVLSGWGARNYSTNTDGVLRDLDVPILSYSRCKAAFINETMFTPTSYCTLPSVNGPCPLDFGDPLVYHNELIGMFSGSKPCGSIQHPPVFVDVTKFKRWIQRTMKIRK